MASVKELCEARLHLAVCTGIGLASALAPEHPGLVALLLGAALLVATLVAFARSLLQAALVAAICALCTASGFLLWVPPLLALFLLARKVAFLGRHLPLLALSAPFLLLPFAGLVPELCPWLGGLAPPQRALALFAGGALGASAILLGANACGHRTGKALFILATTPFVIVTLLLPVTFEWGEGDDS